MKIAIFTDMFLPSVGGIITSTCHQAEELVKRGYDVAIFAPGERKEICDYKGAKVYYLDSKTFLFSDFRISHPHQFGKELENILLKEKPDVFHIQTPFPIGLAGIYYGRKFKKPIVMTLHGDVETYTAQITKGRFEKLIKNTAGKLSMAFIKFLCNRCTKVITPGNSIDKYFRDYGIKNTVVIPSGIAEMPKQKGRIGIRKKYGIPRDAEIILYFGRISFEKRIDVLVRAFDVLEKTNKKAFLLIAGTGPQLKPLENQVKKMNLKNVKFAGFVPNEEVLPVFKASSIFASASDTEAQGLTFVEALFAGKPIVGADRFGAQDMIFNHKNGFLFKPVNAKEMAEKMSLILNDRKLAKRMGIESRRISKEYTVDKFVNRITKLYEDVVRHNV
ncbi:MAG: glycosyltransferase [Candidatus Nanoarchaeia archaeon]|nr:glycosyltransferase [Candidatus Nanoarchaeia archaeon]MDD5238994.1 glycosyltransferase [Candidatus Nanoarchaeia archaeon]